MLVKTGAALRLIGRAARGAIRLGFLGAPPGIEALGIAALREIGAGPWRGMRAILAHHLRLAAQSFFMGRSSGPGGGKRFTGSGAGSDALSGKIGLAAGEGELFGHGLGLSLEIRLQRPEAYCG